MNILIAGRLGRYADRVCALRDAGHNLVYCTMQAPIQKPLPDDLKDASIPKYKATASQAGPLVARICAAHEIDVIYSLKNVWDGSLELLNEILDAGLDVPVVRHYKEHFCRASTLERRSLVETAGQIYINEESFDYFRRTYQVRLATAHILDTDYLPARYLAGELRPKLRRELEAPHLLMAGGLSSNGGRNDVRGLCRDLAGRGVRVHLYGRKFVGHNEAGVWGVDHEPTMLAYQHLEDEGCCRLHDHVEPDAYVSAWSGYDAGLMHPARAADVDPFAAFNYPNRLAPYVASGLPLAQQRGMHRAMERLIEREGIGLLYDTNDQLAEMLHDASLVQTVTDAVLRRRPAFTYEHHVPALIDVLSHYARARTS